MYFQEKSHFFSKQPVNLSNLWNDGDFVDVTLATADNKTINCHKMILSLSSSFFKTILRRNQHSHPLIYLKDIEHKYLLSIIEFVYTGQCEVESIDAHKCLIIAEALKINGFKENFEEKVVSKNVEQDAEIEALERYVVDEVRIENTLLCTNKEDLYEIKTTTDFTNKLPGNINFEKENTEFSFDNQGHFNHVNVKEKQSTKTTKIQNRLHQSKPISEFPCPKCTRVFQRIGSLVHHIKNNCKNKTCHMCGKTLSCMKALRLHMISKHDEK